MGRRETGFPPKVKLLIAVRASVTGEPEDAICEVQEVCHGARSGPAHHRRPRRAGGDRRPETNKASNGLAACPACHDWIESHRTVSKERGWLLETDEIPSRRPVLRRGLWVLLTDSGGLVDQEVPFGEVS